MAVATRSEKGSRSARSKKIESAMALVFILEPKSALFYSFVGFAQLGCGMFHGKGVML
jgi:hypothetical protein